MKCYKYILCFLLIVLVTCSQEEDDSNKIIEEQFSCGVISSEILNYSANELDLLVNFFVFDKENNDKLTSIDISDKLVLEDDNYDFDGELNNFNTSITPEYGNYSCFILLDDLFNQVTYNHFDNVSGLENFIRMFFHNSGHNNYFNFANSKIGVNPLTIYNDEYTNNAKEFDLPLAKLCHEMPELTEKADSMPLLTSIDSVLEFINLKAPDNNRNLLLLCSDNAFSSSGINTNKIINKAIQYNIRVHTILGAGGDSKLIFSRSNFLFKLSNATGGIMYELNSDVFPLELLILASNLKNILEGYFQCFQSTWTLKSNDLIFVKGYLGEPLLEVYIQTNYDKEAFQLPFCFEIK